jgi:hypothetical protein
MEESKLTPEDELRLENELKALDLEITHGATNFIADDAPPELVKMFLDNVAKFEAAHADAKLVPLRQLLQIEGLPPTMEVPEDELETHIESVLALLEKHGIVIDRPEHLSPRGYYHFLAEEFLDHEVTDYSAPGMIQAFSYDEFRHDGPEFIREHVEETLLDLLNLGQEFEGKWISEHCRDQTNAIDRAEVLRRIQAFRARYATIVPIAFQPEGVQRTEAGMYFFFLIAWEGTPAAGGEPERYEGPGVSQIDWEEGEWLVQGIMMPGFEF